MGMQKFIEYPTLTEFPYGVQQIRKGGGKFFPFFAGEGTLEILVNHFNVGRFHVGQLVG